MQIKVVIKHILSHLESGHIHTTSRIVNVNFTKDDMVKIILCRRNGNLESCISKHNFESNSDEVISTNQYKIVNGYENKIKSLIEPLSNHKLLSFADEYVSKLDDNIYGFRKGGNMYVFHGSSIEKFIKWMLTN